MGFHWPWTKRGLDNPLEKLTDDELSQKKAKWDGFRKGVSTVGLWGFRIGGAAFFLTAIAVTLELTVMTYIVGSVMAAMGAVIFPAAGIMKATQGTADLLDLETKHRLKRPFSKAEEYHREMKGQKIKKEFQAVTQEGLTQNIKVRAPLKIAAGPFCAVPAT